MQLDSCDLIDQHLCNTSIAVTIDHFINMFIQQNIMKYSTNLQNLVKFI